MWCYIHTSSIFLNIVARIYIVVAWIRYYWTFSIYFKSINFRVVKMYGNIGKQ